MSSTNSSDGLALLSYATFNHHIPIHDHSWRQHQWKQMETMVALALLSLQSAKKLFQKGNLENKRLILTSAGADICTRSIGIGDFNIKKIGTFPYTIKLNHSVLSSSDRRSLWRILCSLVYPKTQHLKSLFCADIVYLQQLQQVMVDADHSFSLRAVSMPIGQSHKWPGLFPPRWHEQRENLKPLVLRNCLWFS